MEPGFKITTIHAFICTEPDGTEGVASMQTAAGLVPLIAADEARLDSLRPIAEALVEGLPDTKVTLARFSVRSDLETIER